MTDPAAPPERNLGYSPEAYRELASFDSDWRDSWWSDDFLELVARRHELGRARRLLDVGCGAGHWGQRVLGLASPEATLVGVDHEAAFLDDARARAEARGIGARVELREGAAEALPFEDASFDLVTCQTVLIHVADGRTVLREMVRVLRPGGVLLVAEPNNRINAMARHASCPVAAIDELLARLEFDERCIRGKRALRGGDVAIGERLASIFVELGLERVGLCKNERCAELTPPYDDPSQRALIEQARGNTRKGYTAWGDRDTARRLYVAGGGDPGRFEAAWDRELSAMRRDLEAIEAGTHVFGGGFVLYLAAGRKPG